MGGIYKISYIIQTGQNSQVAIFLNNVIALQSVYNSGNATNYGICIMYLHEAKWKKYDSLKGADILLLSTGIDKEYYMRMLFERDEEKYGIEKKVTMNSVILDYLGVNYPDSIDEISEEGERTKQLVICLEELI
jgi:hypothetical protein